MFNKIKKFIKKLFYKTGEVYTLGPVEYLGKIERKPLIFVEPRKAEYKNGKCLHVNKGWFQLGSKIDNYSHVFYHLRCCNDCHRWLSDNGLLNIDELEIRIKNTEGLSIEDANNIREEFRNQESLCNM